MIRTWRIPLDLIKAIQSSTIGVGTPATPGCPGRSAVYRVSSRYDIGPKLCVASGSRVVMIGVASDTTIGAILEDVDMISI